MKKFAFVFILLLNSVVFGQLTLPRESQRQEISQTVGDAKVSIVYHRPNVKARKIWGCKTKDVIPIANNLYHCLVPNGQVWRTGANENTTIEFSRDVSINGQALPAGKYGFHIIPTKTDWTLIFSKDNDKWGSFTYDEKKDALRVKIKPVKTDLQETLSYEFENITPNTGQVVLRWEKIAVPFTFDIGDIHGACFPRSAKRLKIVKATTFALLTRAQIMSGLLSSKITMTKRSAGSRNRSRHAKRLEISAQKRGF